ncbi:hypothetical protein HOLleu_24628 [Holothuria leucospilota]|uniref:Uncharacterized protein n=1 Tax=Holothuria leucospilota TaxID=206669 RepID=A0A9Q1H2V7_HOLLE|nr:hypothetical protein HOLleu_24628 [Holothuria leucospilota]
MTGMASPAASMDTTTEVNSRDETEHELDSLNLLQVEMTKTTKELERLRLDLFQCSEKIEDKEEHKDTLCGSFVVPGLPKERTKSALERITARQKGFKVTELSLKSHQETNLAATVDGRNVQHFSDEENLPKIGAKGRDVIDLWKDPTGSIQLVTEKREVEVEETARRSLSTPRLGERYKELQLLNSSKSLPLLVEGNHDVDLSRASSWDQETATGRVLLQSLANENKLEEELVLSKEEIRELTDQLHQLKSHYEREAEKNRETVHALLQRVDEISKKKQEELEVRDQENRAKEEVIKQLQKTLQDAETAMKVMEKVLDETKGCLNLERKKTSTKDQALLQIYEAVKPKLGGGNQESGDEEMRKNIVTKTPLLVAERVKGYIDGREGQVLELMKQLEETEQRFKEHQLDMEGALEKLKSEHKEKLFQLNESHDRQLESLSERASNARQQTLGLQAQISAVEEHSQLEMKGKEIHIRELTGTIESLKEKLQEAANESHTKLQNIQTQLQGTQSLLEDRNAAKLQLETEIASLRKQLQENEETMKSTSSTLDEVMSKNGTLSREKEELLSELSECKKSLEEKVGEITQLREKLREDKEKSERHLQQEISRLETEATIKVAQKEKENESQVAAWREKYEKVQTELEKRNVELGLQKETKQAFVIKMKELESQTETVSKEKTELASTLDAREKDLIVLQHERNLMANLYEKLKKESQEELRKKDKLEGDLNEIEPRYRELLVENQELLDKLEKEEKKVLNVAEDKTNIKSELERTKKELEKVKLNRSNVLKKLNIREKRLKHAEEDLMKEGKRLEMKNLELEKLQKERDFMEVELKKERNKIEKITKENTSTLQQVSEKQSKDEKEKRILKSQINILQNELRLVKGALGANKAVDEKAVQFAEDMRKNAEMKRSLLESLQSKNYYLEEQLEAAQKNTDRLEVENKKLQASCKKVERKLERLGKENEGMAERRKEQRVLLVKLEAALEKAALKFSESQRVIEKQEQDIARLKLQHQLELKELKGNLLNQFTMTHILPKVKKASSDIPVNNITPSKEWASEAVGKDLKEKPKVEKTRQDLETKQDVEEELKRFLGEMYQMLRGRGDLRGSGRDHTDLEDGVDVRKPHRWNNQSVTDCDFEEELRLPVGSPGDNSRHRPQPHKLNKVQYDEEEEEDAFPDAAASSNQSPSISVNPLSPVSTLLHQEALSMRHISPEMKGIKANLYKTQYQTEQEKDGKTMNQETKKWNNANGEQEMNIKMMGLQRKLERLAVMGDELKENNKDMERFLEIDGT